MRFSLFVTHTVFNFGSSWRILEVFLMLLTCFCVCSRQTGAINRVIDRGSRAINYILTVMVFNVVPIILEVLTDCCVWMLWSISCACCQWCYFLRQIFFFSNTLESCASFIKKEYMAFFWVLLILLICRLVWCQAYLPTSLVQLLLGLLQLQLLLILLSLWLSHRCKHNTMPSNLYLSRYSCGFSYLSRHVTSKYVLLYFWLVPF